MGRRCYVKFDLFEYNPMADPGYVTALNANRLLQECLTGIAIHKKGIQEKDYLSPLTVEGAHSNPEGVTLEAGLSGAA